MNIYITFTTDRTYTEFYAHAMNLVEAQELIEDGNERYGHLNPTFSIKPMA